MVEFLIGHNKVATTAFITIPKRQASTLAGGADAQMNHHVVGVVQGNPGQTRDLLLEGISQAHVRLVGVEQEPPPIGNNIQRLLELEEGAGIGRGLENPFEATSVMRYCIVLRQSLLQRNQRLRRYPRGPLHYPV